MKIYIKPTISVVYCSIDSAVLAASPNDGGGSGSATWGDSGSSSITGGGNSGSSSGGTKYPGSTSAKDYSYNAWETWDEF